MHTTKTSLDPDGQRIALSRLRPARNNPRGPLVPADWADLVPSVKVHGVIQPILVRPLDGEDQMEIVAGERRYRAAYEAFGGAYEIPYVWRFQQALHVPYGRVNETIELAGRTIPRQLVDAFIEGARRVSARGVGAIVTCDVASGEWALRLTRSVLATACALSYERPRLGRTERRVVDIHSHGDSPASLSETDRRDTAGATAVVMVVGRLDRDTPDVKIYLYLQGLCMPLPWVQIKDDCGPQDGDTNGRIEVALHQQ